MSLPSATTFLCTCSPYPVQLDMYGMPVDREEQISASVANSGRLVVGRDFDFVVRFPEMAVLVVQLMDENTGEGTALGHT